MSEDLTIAYQLGVEDMRSRLHKQADEIERLRERLAEADEANRRVSDENEKLREALIEECQSSEKENRRKRAYYDEVIAAEKVISELRAENEKLRVQLNEQIASSKQLRDFIVQYSQRYGRMREALKPFAYYASQIPEDVSNTASASGTVGDLRAAAAAIRESGQ